MTIYIQLGRSGDILSFLPLLWKDFQDGQRNALMVQKDYAPLLEGVGYCDCIPFDGELWDLDKAVAEARKLSDTVKCVQCIGPTEVVKRCSYEPAGLPHATTESFQKEAWKLAGRFDEWNKGYPLVFDKRNTVREAELLKGLPNQKPHILVSLNGHSSPFVAHELVVEILRLRFKSKFHIVDLSTIKAQRFYDLLGLFESAHCLVVSDSGPLHLAYANPKLPVVALVNDRPALWNGSVFRPNHIAHIRYSDFPSRGWDIVRAIEEIGESGSTFNRQLQKPKIVHVWSAYEITDENLKRHLNARTTWDFEYMRNAWVSAKVEVGAVGRDSKFSRIKDEFRFPYVKDVIRVAALRAEDEDIICLTRCDTCFEEDLTHWLLEHWSKLPLWSHRRLRTTKGDTFHPYCDLFAFTKQWWKDNQEDLPDLLLSIDGYWNRVFLAFVQKHGGRELPSAIYREPSYAIPLKRDKVPAREAWNEMLDKKWSDTNGEFSLCPKVSDQIETVIVNHRALFPNGYNPSIIRHDGKLLMAYRYHDENNLSTALAIAELDDKFNVTSNAKILCPKGGASEEDPRLFLIGNELHMLYVDSIYPKMPPKAVVRYGKLVKEAGLWKLTDMVQPDYAKNDMSSCEKNWVFFDSADDFVWLLYQSSPEQIIIQLVKGKFNAQYIHPGLFWSWGAIKGGTTPLAFGNNFIRFFHSTLDNEMPPNRRRYYLGAVVTSSNEAPFMDVVVMSKKPIARGSELDDLTEIHRSSISHHKKKVIFPAGAIAMEDGWLVSCGINDSQCALLKVTEKGLNL